MTAEEIFVGETDNVEFKEDIPARSEKYMKTVVAFANGKGGKLIFGVENNTWKVTGFTKEEVFQKMDAITNAIFDSCEPKITPNVGVQEVDGKAIIEVEILPGMPRPYYIRSQGILDGTYIRVSGTTRHAERYQVQELILEGQNRHYDCEPVEDLTLTEEDITKLCANMKEMAIRNAVSEVEKAKVRDVTKNTLLSWGVLSEKDGAVIPTNAYALLTGRAQVQPVVQCGIFKGSDRAYFVDRREFKGSIQDQMEAAFQYVLEKINRGMTIQGVQRQDMYELPLDSVRELIANSIAHRSYLEPGNIQIALFDNRLEVTSPGMLLNGVSIAKMKEGYSKIRNRAIANAFSYMKIIEKWGSGIPRIIRECKEYGLPEPEFLDFDGDFRVNMFRQTTSNVKGISDTKNETNDTKNDTNETIAMRLIDENPAITQKEMKEKMGVSLATIKRLMSNLQKSGKIQRQGSSRSGKWLIADPKE
ncbi:ATP-dependent DNA helicase RecG [Aequitasia blattaphilus]|uniref:DNA binding domain-containing protein n=1 Tax=Aequitasia blattaphilus TaxID=2949332 RepID=A0ABT1E4M3_9FIRM|nr:ATP-binding protein [Aequitasia blattaphilus]MCP1100797.1 putative DNA binding domain-containing protein [Aequitasia blattaphilus]MCR8613437.1 putative DNA binding domain-containing protein [Aequitasia blattaphilus]